MKRVWTETLECSTGHRTATFEKEVVDRYRAQEDMTLIGFEMHGHFSHDDEIDGVCEAHCILTSTAPPQTATGRLGSIAVAQCWNTVVAAAEQIQEIYGDKVVMWPAGYGVTLREGEELLGCIDGRVTAGKDMFITFRITLYLVKGI